MMKYLPLLAAMTLGLHLQAQTVEATSFENWTGGLPDGWAGSKTSLELDSIEQADVNIQYGQYAVRLVNAESGHKRFTTQSLTVDSGETYTISFYARGGGEIRTGLFDGRATGFGYASYNSYNTVTTTWVQYSQQVQALKDTTGAEFILSVRNTVAANGHMEVDSVRIFIGTVLPPTTVSIHDIQFTTNPNGDSPLVGQTVNTGGVVIAGNSSGYFLQNGGGAWNGIYVFDNVNAPAIGDSVTLTANVEEYFSMTQLNSVQNFAVVNSGNADVDVVISTGDANLEDYEGVLITVNAAQCTNADVGSNFGQWQVNDGSGMVFVDDLFYAYTPVLNSFYNVTGPMMYSFSERKIEPRDMNDVSVVSGIGEAITGTITVHPNPARDRFMVDLGTFGERATYSLMDMQGRMVSEGLLTGDRAYINVDDIESGRYLLLITANSGIRTGIVQVLK